MFAYSPIAYLCLILILEVQPSQPSDSYSTNNFIVKQQYCTENQNSDPFNLLLAKLTPCTFLSTLVRKPTQQPSTYELKTQGRKKGQRIPH